jgi:hypothetical protein
MHSLSGEFGCNRSADSSVCTGYQRNFSAKIEFHLPPPPVVWDIMGLKWTESQTTTHCASAKVEKNLQSTMALFNGQSYIRRTGLQERNICQKMCWA